MKNRETPGNAETLFDEQIRGRLASPEWDTQMAHRILAVRKKRRSLGLGFFFGSSLVAAFLLLFAMSPYWFYDLEVFLDQNGVAFFVNEWSALRDVVVME